MTTGNDDDIRALVRKAYETVSEPAAFDVTAGLRDVVRRARRPEPQPLPDLAEQLAHVIHRGERQGSRSANGTLVARTFYTAITAEPREGVEVVFGRDSGNVTVVLGADDASVGRRQGRLDFRNGRWWLTNIGRVPIQAGSRVTFTEDGPIAIDQGYTMLFVQGSEARLHQLELYVVGDDHIIPPPLPNTVEPEPVPWTLSPDERLVLVVFAQRYLRGEPNPRPWSRREATLLLKELDPAARWTARRAEELVYRVRVRWADSRVRGSGGRQFGAQRPDLGDLIRYLIVNGTLSPRDLDLLDGY
ncbi:FHA domain-containing protein [Nocardia wallacei]|uniref:FHA domain-containing protein n=1 Tax=Nocardia wallacei TaxID=480035 RepID=UPI002454BC55|nr:FHA domain-containing protein [Nocardia wallacei]